MATDPSIAPSQCSFKISTKRDLDYPKVISHIDLKATHPTLGNIGRLTAVRILRENCRGRFLQVMDVYSQELHEFAVALFDKFGHVRPWIIEDGKRKGTGCWGRELNWGALIYVMDMSVEPKHRSRGIGSRMLTHLKESDLVKPGDTIICWPSPVGIRDRERWVFMRDKQVAFFHTNGFRRIGRTGFFGFYPNEFHPSHTLPVEADAELLEDEFDSAPDEALDEAEVIRTYPIHFAICHDQSQRVSLIIRSQYATDPSSIHKKDTSGFTPISVAANKGHVHAVRTLLELGAASDVLDNHNRAGMNALERGDANMRTTREFSEAMLGDWDGNAADPLRCEFLLRKAMGLPTLSETEDGYVDKRKWGCTCGGCAGAWLSPRMCFRLKKEAKGIIDMMKNEYDTNPYLQREESTVDVDTIADLASLYLPPDVCGFVNKTFYRGYQRIFTTIHDSLHTATEPLFREMLTFATVANADVMLYVREGGKYEYAFDALTNIAFENSVYGDGSFEERWVSDDEETEYTKLPACANDLEFLMVRERLGLKGGKEWGPYGLINPEEDEDGPGLLGDDDEQEEDEDDDDADY